MYLSPGCCPICEKESSDNPERCPGCHSLILWGPDWPAFDRLQVSESDVQAGIEHARRQLKADMHDGTAHYSLGLAYMNVGLREQGLDELRRAATLLPEQHGISYEVALIEAAAGQSAAAQDYIDRALQQAPEQRAYRYVKQYLAGVSAHDRNQVNEAIRCWSDAYTLDSDATPARDALQQFVQAHESRLSRVDANEIPGVHESQRRALALLNGRINAETQRLPSAPRAPRPLGKTSMRILHKLAHTRAEALEQMHANRFAAYQAAIEAYEQQRQNLDHQNEQMRAMHEERLRQVRNDLPLMATLCAAVLESDRQQQQAAERQRQEQAEQQQKAAVASAATSSNAAVASPTKSTVKERRYLKTRGRYIQGLPLGKQNDKITLIVTNQRLILKHPGLLGGWEQTLPMDSLVEVTDERLKHKLFTKNHLRISYRDSQGLLSHILIAGVRVDQCVARILQARSNS